MAKQIDKGIELLAEDQGVGIEAKTGHLVTYNARFFLRKGDEVTTDNLSIASYRSNLKIRIVDGIELIDHSITLGRRQPIAGIEKSLYGMRPGGYREVLVSSHLAYGAKGVKNRIPPNAMLRIKLWVQNVQPAT
ncbi:MAG: FKBP-type peptidyl-prolyl cis-trans isomerase [Gammaproteobacteria bacterium]|nr:FKBP-type peptidyl-prolyl cis-trans isomerase [Gammaproteobacteria bacterium]MDH3469402.1 FKBP-type peptidyl-prolyl cis-trans isomerase [Gammaproteobacteria bacterium]